MSARVLCAGEVVVDLVLTVPHLPGRGGDVLATGVTRVPGGATNVMLAARRQGAPVTYAGLLGTGPNADLARAALLAEGVQLPLPPRAGTDTAAVITFVEPDGERAFVTTLGAEADLTVEDLAAVERRPDDVVYVSGYGLAYPRNGAALAGWVPTLPDTATVLLDPGPLVTGVPPDVLDPVLARTDWLSASRAEAVALVGDGTAAELAARLRGQVRAGAVVRLGEGGAVVAAYDALPTLVPPFPVHAVDRTGAGDAHTGTFAAALASMSPFDVIPAVRRANAAAALAVTRAGSATGPSADETDAVLAGRHRSIGRVTSQP